MELLPGKIEAILFVAGDAVELQELERALNVSRLELEEALQTLTNRYDDARSGLMVKRFGNRVQLATRPEFAADVARMLQPIQKQSLSQALMETLAVIAYRQPVTKAEIEQLRGIRCDYAVQTLTAKGMIQELGRKEVLGRPILYGTTLAFLEHFGLMSLDNLPPLPEAAEEAAEPAEELTP